MNTRPAGNGGIGILGMVFITFLVLKLCGIITWSWWWITAPLWIPCAAFIITIILIVAVILVYKSI